MNAPATQPRPRRSHPRARAFTLLEVVVALGMTGVLVVAVFGSLAIGFRARRSALAKVEPVRELANALALMREDLEAAVRPTGMLAVECISIDEVDGEVDRDEFLFYAVATHMPWANHPVGLRRVEYAIEADETTGISALHRYTIFNTNAPLLPEPERELLCPNVRSFNLRFYDGSSWEDEWDSEFYDGSMPSAVEITLELLADPDDPESEDEVGPRITSIVNIPIGGNVGRSTEGAGGNIIR